MTLLVSAQAVSRRGGASRHPGSTQSACIFCTIKKTMLSSATVLGVLYQSYTSLLAVYSNATGRRRGRHTAADAHVVAPWQLVVNAWRPHAHACASRPCISLPLWLASTRGSRN